MVINCALVQKGLVGMVNYVGIVLVTKCPIFNVHFQHRIQIIGFASGLAVGRALQRRGMTSEPTGGMAVSEATALLAP